MARAGLKALANERRSLADVFATEVSDRAAAIIEATQLDARLKSAILGRMVPLTSGEEGSLFKGDAPLASLSARIRMAYAMGIISKETRSDLDAIRDIRNVFAHALKPTTFETPAIRSACLSLKASPRKSPISAREHCEGACIAILIQLRQADPNFIRPETPDDPVKDSGNGLGAWV